MNIQAISVPYDSGHRSVRMGRGPEYLIENGLKDALSEIGDVEVLTMESESRLPAEVSVAFELDRHISRQVRRCRESGDFPLVMSGNCNNSVGTMAGIGCEDLGVVWLDGHVDFNTPDTTTSGFSDNMGLSIAVGDCWSGMLAQVPGFSPVQKRNIVVVGSRDIEPAEQIRLNDSEIPVFGLDSLKDTEGLVELDLALGELGERTRAVYLHLDLDVLDPELVGAANEFAPASGLTGERAERIVHLIRERCRVAAVGIASYDPALDHDDNVFKSAIRLATAVF